MYKLIISALISGAVTVGGYVINAHLSDHQRFKDSVNVKFTEIENKAGSTKRLIIKNDVIDTYQGDELDAIRDRINRLESAIYDLSHEHQRKANGND